MTKGRTYYSLALRDDNHGFCFEFGDYDRKTVEYEMAEYTAHDYLKRNARIVSSTDDQASIEAAIIALT